MSGIPKVLLVMPPNSMPTVDQFGNGNRPAILICKGGRLPYFSKAQ
jgi:hypothetical protein